MNPISYFTWVFCNQLFSHEAQGQNVPNSLIVGMGSAYMFQVSHKQGGVAILILINTSVSIKFRIVTLDN